MTLKLLIRKIAKREGKKVQVSIGNIREIVSVICDIEVEAMLANKSGPLKYLSNEINKRAQKAFAKQRRKERRKAKMAKKSGYKSTKKKPTVKKKAAKKKSVKKKTAKKKAKKK